ncbi:phosphotransferase system IIB component [Clostridium tetanomorphum]|nr:hypothetical protein [Clostridium tetanomorphum]KAJ53412.1 hypothetical protein CTM_02939 [Clostridium tetanomorphum DSM 665]MBP1863931.1 phosphotransferase system IIB component [Clostridium tetanomorphum]NRS85009.1 phosphotransferase system IIB component [Clostridium tetanomorphum]NRZ98225.1 phosphotransferase system IIB component [Clostridium tetanomorphum]SQB91465.1 Uncharacterised protein [Clostridium tetanomorphum]
MKKIYIDIYEDIKIVAVSHCVTGMRFVLKDTTLRPYSTLCFL